MSSPSWEAETHLAAAQACRLGHDLATWLEAQLTKRRSEAEGDAEYSSLASVVEYADREVADIDAKLPLIAHLRAVLTRPERDEETVTRYLAVRSLQYLAQPYATRPGYRAEWSP